MKKILLIDDDADDREIFELALESLNVKTELVYAADGEVALKLAESDSLFTPDFIFLDLNMPKLNGLGLLSALRSKNLYPDIPVFIYTTSSVGPDIDKCLELGGQLITKHGSFQELCEELRKLLA